MVKKYTIAFLLICVTSLFANEVQMQTIDVNASIDTEVVENIHGEDVKSADLAEALFKQSPSISIVRRSGIANDIIVRGQKKDNINITIDGVKLYGACPNRMDPPISHVLTNNIDYIKINEGPYNVEDSGVLSADVKIHTLKPKKEFHGDTNIGLGGWGYQKEAALLTGGTDRVRFLISGSVEASKQYEDGNGNDFAEQIQREIDTRRVISSVQYQNKYKNLSTYNKKTLMTKLFWDIANNQELRLSHTQNRSDDVLYPSSKMDALYDNSDIYNIEYQAKGLGPYSKELYFQLYRSSVEHPMSTKYRKMAIIKGEITHKLNTQVDGIKLKHTLEVGKHTITVGANHTLRNWDGGYYKNGNPFPSGKFHSIWDTNTKNIGLFVSDTINLNKLILDFGLRYDDTLVTSENLYQQHNNYNEVNGYINGTYHIDDTLKVFAGLGKSSRVPDAKELYWYGSKGNEIGTPTLNNVVNYEFDLAVEKQWDSSIMKLKAFYSKLNNFIAYNDNSLNGMNLPYHAYENTDAVIYGFELSGTHVASETLYVDYGLAYQRGKKKNPLFGQSGTNMPEISPLKFNATTHYDWDDTFSFETELIVSAPWNKYDEENGEQKLLSYSIINIKAIKILTNFELTIGIDNILDTTYAVSNTYKDMILLPTVAPNNTIMLMNEPGRYIYTNLKFPF
ncbi:MAG: TonB-dependent receptor [Sulfurovum sp.]|nr:TonB-dependent receptor [Sulfurovum sp.]